MRVPGISLELLGLLGLVEITSNVGTARMVPVWWPWLLIALLQGGVPFAYLRRPMLAST